MKVLITFFILLITWVFFRAENFEVAARYLTVMFGGGVRHATAGLMDADMLRGYIMSQFAVCVVVTWFLPNTQTILHRFVWWKAFLGLFLFVIAVAMMFARGHSPFLYFQF